MTRVKRGTLSVKKREKILRLTKGFKWGRKSKERQAKEALMHAYKHAYQGRKLKKRINRADFQVRINAAVRKHGLTYSKFIKLLKGKNVLLDRKIMAEIAAQYPKVFEQIVKKIQEK
jgi:large subunit ribosomal protein L20